MMGHAVTWRPWRELAYFGAPIFQYLAGEPEAGAALNEAMTSTSSIDADAVVHACSVGARGDDSGAAVYSSLGSSRMNFPARRSASVCSISARVFITNGP